MANCSLPACTVVTSGCPGRISSKESSMIVIISALRSIPSPTLLIGPSQNLLLALFLEGENLGGNSQHNNMEYRGQAGGQGLHSNQVLSPSTDTLPWSERMTELLTSNLHFLCGQQAGSVWKWAVHFDFPISCLANYYQ